MPRPKTFSIDVVLDAAMELFWERGYRGTSMQMIGDHVMLHFVKQREEGCNWRREDERRRREDRPNRPATAQRPMRRWWDK